MKKFLLFLGALFLAVAVAAALFLATFDADRYRPMVAQKMEAALGRPVKLAHLGVSWKGGLAVELQGLEVPPSLKVGSLSALLRFVPLLRGNLQVASVAVVSPQGRLIRHSNGTIGLEGLTPPPGAAASAVSAAPASKPVQAAPLLIRDLQVQGGTLTVVDETQNPPLELKLKKIKVRAGLDLKAERLDLKEASAEVGDGAIEASGSLQRFGSSPEGELRLKSEKLILPHLNLLRELFDRLTLIPGLTDKLLADLPPSYADKLKAEETRFRPMDLAFTLKNNAITLRKFRVATDDFELAGSGTYGLDGSLAIPAQIFIQPDLSAALIKSVDELRFFTDDRWRIVLPIRVEGTLQKPVVSPDLKYAASKLFSSKAQDIVGELFNRVLEKKKKKEKQPSGG